VLSVYLDALATSPAAVCNVSGSAGLWQTVVCPLHTDNRFKGVHDLLFSVQHQPPPIATSSLAAAPVQHPPSLNVLVAFAWWQLHGGAAFVPTTPTFAAVPVSMFSSSAAGSARLGLAGNKLVASNSSTLATIVLHDNEDGTWALQLAPQPPAGGRVGTAVAPPLFACTTTPASGDGEAELLATATAPDQHCARFRLQVLKDGTFALRSAAVGLWVSVSTGAGGVLAVAAHNPLLDAGSAFYIVSLSATDALPPT
jgi:hypothetical protein